MNPPERLSPWSARLAVLLGAPMLVSGLLKLLSPFRDWYGVQIAASNLPRFSYPLGIVSEVLVGALFLVPLLLGQRLPIGRRAVWSLASAWMVGIMLVATYVHLHPAVPASVLPLKFKPPVIPLVMLVMASANLVVLTRRRSRRLWSTATAPRPR